MHTAAPVQLMTGHHCPRERLPHPALVTCGSSGVWPGMNKQLESSQGTAYARRQDEPTTQQIQLHPQSSTSTVSSDISTTNHKGVWRVVLNSCFVWGGWCG